MSRNNSDWQRRKAHDNPILSPVEVKSSDSNNVSTQEVSASPPRPYSPLPPLIIEKVPITNKHDESAEFYDKLFIKIKRIYIKLFIENRNFSSIDSNASDITISDNNAKKEQSENTDRDGIRNESSDKSRPSGNKECSRERTGNLKFSGGEDSPLSIIYDDEITESEEFKEPEDEQSFEKEGSDNENFDGDGITNESSDKSRPRGNKECNIEGTGDLKFIGGEDSPHSIIYDDEMTKMSDDDEMSAEFNEPEDEQSFEKESLSNASMICNVSDIMDDFVVNDEPMEAEVETISDDSNEGPYYIQSTTEAVVTVDGSRDIRERENEGKESYGNMTTSTEQNGGPYYIQSTTEAVVTVDGSRDIRERENEGKESYGNMTTSTEQNGGPYYIQSTTEAVVTVDGSRDIRERENEGKESYGNMTTSTEQNGGPYYIQSTTEAVVTVDGSRDIRERENEGKESYGNMTTSTEQNGGPYYIQSTTEAVVTVDGSRDIRERENEGKESYGNMTTSTKQDRETQTNEDNIESTSAPPMSGRKRKLINKSVQTVQRGPVTCNEICSFYFIGIPKIFRLCTCTDHNCH